MPFDVRLAWFIGLLGLSESFRNQCTLFGEVLINRILFFKIYIYIIFGLGFREP